MWWCIQWTHIWKKTQEMTTSQEPTSSSSSFAFEEKNQEVTRGWQTHCHLLHLRKKLRNDKPPDLPSYVAFEKKNNEMTMSHGGSLSSTTFEIKKAKKWQWIREAHCHLLHLTKIKWWQASWLIVIFYTQGGKKTKRWWQAKEARHHLLHLRKNK